MSEVQGAAVVWLFVAWSVLAYLVGHWDGRRTERLRRSRTDDLAKQRGQQFMAKIGLHPDLRTKWPAEGKRE